MALARLALKNLQRTASSSAAQVASPVQRHRSSGSQLLCRLSSYVPAAEQEKPSAAGDVAADGSGRKKSTLFPRRRSLWKRNTRDDYVPAIWDIVPYGLGSVLLQATEKINRLTELTWHLLGLQAKEHDDVYKLRCQMPGLAKEDLKITVEDGVLNIRGEHKKEEEEEGSGYGYGYYNTSVLLPDDAKVDEIKAEMKDGVLNIVVPKSETANKDVKEVQVL